MKQVLNALALSSIAAVLALATPACTKSAKDPETTGYINAAITVGGSRHDVTAIRRSRRPRLRGLAVPGPGHDDGGGERHCRGRWLWLGQRRLHALDPVS